MSSIGPASSNVAARIASGGIFAPTLRHHDGRFWMITTNWSDDGANCWSGRTTRRARGRIRSGSPARWASTLTWRGIDDGTCYLTYAGFGPAGSDGIVAVVHRSRDR